MNQNNQTHAINQYFLSFYEIENIQDKAKFEESVKALNEISEMIKSETGIVLKKDEAKKYQEDIDALIKTYNKRVEEIKEAEKKAKSKK